MQDFMTWMTWFKWSFICVNVLNIHPQKWTQPSQSMLYQLQLSQWILDTLWCLYSDLNFPVPKIIFNPIILMIFHCQTLLSMSTSLSSRNLNIVLKTLLSLAALMVCFLFSSSVFHTYTQRNTFVHVKVEQVPGFSFWHLVYIIF